MLNGPVEALYNSRPIMDSVPHSTLRI